MNSLVFKNRRESQLIVIMFYLIFQADVIYKLNMTDR